MICRFAPPRHSRSALVGAALLTACAGQAGPPISPPPRTLALDPFYAKYLSAGGIAVTASAQVPDEALTVAASLIDQMTAHRPDLRREIARQGIRVAVMAENEATTDLPEQRDWKKPTLDDPRLTRCERIHYEERIGRLSDRDYWNARARGMAGPLTSGSVEDLLGLPSSRYYGETIFVHEMSHAILSAIRTADPKLYAQVEAAYAHALETDLWKDEYASTTVDEYWAEGSQFWFNSNRLAVFDSVRILSDDDLKGYDPALHAVLAQAYGDTHRLIGDPFYLSQARVPPGPPPENTAEQC